MHQEERTASPGPWRMQPTSGRWCDVLDANGQPINVDFDNPANAALTAAAHDLRDALERMLYCIVNKIEIGPGTIKQAHNALAKANRID